MPLKRQDVLVPSVPGLRTVPTRPPDIRVDDTYCPPNIATGQKVTTTAAQLLVASRNTRAVIVITNMTGADQYIGNSSNVTTASGDLLPGGKGNSKSYPTQSQLWIIGASAGQVSYVEYHN